MKQFILAILVAFFGLYIAGGLFGCSSDMSVADKIQIMQATVDIAKEAGVEASIDVDLPTNVGMMSHTMFGSPGYIRASLRVNPNNAQSLATVEE